VADILTNTTVPRRNHRSGHSQCCQLQHSNELQSSIKFNTQCHYTQW